MRIFRKIFSIYSNLIIGILYLAVITFATFESKFEIHYLLFIFFGFYYIITAIYYWKTPLVSLENNEITFYNFLEKKKIYPKESLTVRYSAGDYIFKTPNAEHRITKSSISKTQLHSFEEYINELPETQIKYNLVTS